MIHHQMKSKTSTALAARIRKLDRQISTATDSKEYFRLLSEHRAAVYKLSGYRPARSF